jgi:hypothetical protein
MKPLLLKFWTWLLQKNHALILIIVLALLIMGTIIYFQRNKITQLTDLYETEVKLRDALLDTMRIYQNKEKEWVAEKLTIQETIKNLEKLNGKLTDFQKELLIRITEIEKDNHIIAAALIETKVKVDSLLHIGEVKIDTAKKKITFSDLYKKDKKEVAYSFQIGNVLPAQFNVKPTLFIDSLYFPNKQFVEFHWKDSKKSNYPIAFSVTNSNDYFKTINIDSYAIPELNKDNLNQTGWQKFGQWLSKNGKTLIFIGAGATGGVGTYWLLTR